MSHLLFRMGRCSVAIMLLWITACAGQTPTVEILPTPTPTPTEVPPSPTPTLVPTPTPTATPEPTNNPPVITNLSSSPAVVCPGETTTLSALVNDPDGDALSYTWSTRTGSISNERMGESRLEADYLAADVPGTDLITLTLSDGRGAPDDQQINVEVRGDCPVVISITSPVETLSCTGEEPFCTWETTGTTKYLTTRPDFQDLRLYVLVFPVNPGGSGFYIQILPGSIQPSDGTWQQSPAYLGHAGAPVAAGHTLKIVAVIVSSDAVADTITGTRQLSRMRGSNNDNVVLNPADIHANFFAQSDELELEVSIP